MPRRPRNPSGFVQARETKSGRRWQGIVQYPDPDKPGAWKQRSATFDRKAEAQAWVDTTLTEHRAKPDYRPPSDMTLEQWLTRWLADVAKARVRESTFLSYTNVAERLCSQVGQRTLAELAPVDLQGAYTRLLDKGLSPRSVRYCHFIAKAALEDAVAFGLLQRNPATRLKPPKDVPHEITPPTIEEARRFLRAAEGDRLYALWAFLALTGARKGEALALRWTDIDWTAKTVTIQRTMVGEAGSRAVAAPKTRAGRRVVALSDHLLGVLRQQQNAQRLERVAAGELWENSGYVFTTAIGTWLSPRNVHRSFKQLVAKAGLPSTTRIHDLRHAMATFWLANGVQPKVVAERLGHANVNITLGIYGHLLPNMQADAANALDEAFFGEGEEGARISTTSVREGRTGNLA